MNWPAPTLPPPAEPAFDPPSAPTPVQQPPSEFRRLLRVVPPATWVALLGAALVLIAAGIVVAGNWDASGPAIRFAAVLLVTGALTWAAERLRAVTPTSAAVIAHLGAFLAAPVAMSGASMLGATWPLCLVVGGALAIGATEVQGRRWQRSTLHAGQVVAIALAATGLAALTGTTAGLVAAIASVGLMLYRAHRRAAGLAIVAVLSPLLWALADAGIGAGTFERAGLVGDRLGWSGPVVGVLAAVVLASTARRYRTDALMLAAAAAPVFGAATGLAAIDAPAQLWWSLPALLVMAAEAAWWLLPTDRHRRAIGRIVDLPAIAVAAIGVTTPALVALAEEFGPTGDLAVPLLASAIAVGFAVLRWRPGASFVTDLGLASIASCLVAGAVAVDAPTLLTASLATALVAACGVVGRGKRPIAVYASAWWAVVAIAAAGEQHTTTTVIALALLAMLTTVVVWLRAHLAASNGPWGWAEMSAVVTIGAIATTTVTPWADMTTFLVAASMAVMLVTAFERRFHLWACACGGAAALVATIESFDSSGLESSLWIGWATLAASLAATGALTRSTATRHVAAAAAVITVATWAAGVPLADEQLLGFAVVAAVALSGLAFTTGRRTPFDSAAATAGVLVGMLSGLDVDPVWISGAWFVIGLQLAAYGLAGRQPVMQIGGSVVAVSAAVSAWFTSGADDWLVDLVEPAGITSGDLWMLAATVTAFVAGAAARRTLAVNSWFAYSSGLLITGIWLTSVQLERETVWAIPLAITIGAVASGLGAWRRLAALLVGGMALIATTLVVAVGRDLTDLPTWAWLAAGGMGLLGTAVLIERASKHGPEGLKELAARWR